MLRKANQVWGSSENSYSRKRAVDFQDLGTMANWDFPLTKHNGIMVINHIIKVFIQSKKH